MTGSRADGHDLDKLERWRSGLREGVGAFPVHAMFLVTEADTVAHRAFRGFRSSFEARDASFQHLVIFGQHGVSATAAALARELSTECPPPPVLVLMDVTSPYMACIVPIPEGAAADGSAWIPALSAVEDRVDGGAGRLDTATLLGARWVGAHHPTMAGLADVVASELVTGGGRT